MSAIARVLHLIEKERTEFALKRLLSPSDITLFGYGQTSGFVQGLERAVELINAAVMEPEDLHEQQSSSTFEKHIRGR